MNRLPILTQLNISAFRTKTHAGHLSRPIVVFRERIIDQHVERNRGLILPSDIVIV